MLSTVSDTPKRGRPPQAFSRTEVVSFRISRETADSAYRLAIEQGVPVNRVLRAVLERPALLRTLMRRVAELP